MNLNFESMFILSPMSHKYESSRALIPQLRMSHIECSNTEWLKTDQSNHFIYLEWNWMSLNNADEYRDWSEIENKLRFHLQN